MIRMNIRKTRYFRGFARYVQVSRDGGDDTARPCRPAGWSALAETSPLTISYLTGAYSPILREGANRFEIYPIR
jgi:hypothetical protein